MDPASAQAGTTRPVVLLKNFSVLAIPSYLHRMFDRSPSKYLMRRWSISYCTFCSLSFADIEFWGSGDEL